MLVHTVHIIQEMISMSNGTEKCQIKRCVSSIYKINKNEENFPLTASNNYLTRETPDALKTCQCVTSIQQKHQ